MISSVETHRPAVSWSDRLWELDHLPISSKKGRRDLIPAPFHFELQWEFAGQYMSSYPPWQAAPF